MRCSSHEPSSGPQEQVPQLPSQLPTSQLPTSSRRSDQLRNGGQIRSSGTQAEVSGADASTSNSADKADQKELQDFQRLKLQLQKKMLKARLEARPLAPSGTTHTRQPQAREHQLQGAPATQGIIVMLS